jgi:short-subunit dehydrogenase
VQVTALCPGPVATEFQARAGVSAKPPPWLLRQSADDVARAGYEGFMAGKRLVIPGAANKFMSFLPRILPRSLMLSTIEAYQDKRSRRADGWQRRPPKR